MNPFDPLKKALSKVGVSYHPYVRPGNGQEYIVYNASDYRPEEYADDRAQIDVATVQVHYFTKRDPKEVTARIRREMRRQGFTITNTQELYEKDSALIHTVVEGWIYGESEEQEE